MELSSPGQPGLGREEVRPGAIYEAIWAMGFHRPAERGLSGRWRTGPAK